MKNAYSKVGPYKVFAGERWIELSQKMSERGSWFIRVYKYGNETVDTMRIYGSRYRARVVARMMVEEAGKGFRFSIRKVGGEV